MQFKKLKLFASKLEINIYRIFMNEVAPTNFKKYFIKLCNKPL